MLVFKSTYNELETKAARLAAKLIKVTESNNALEEKYYRLFTKWDSLVDKVNAKGGQNFLNNAVVLDKEILRKMLQLCHPDKHQGKQIAVEVTQFLNSCK